MNKINEGWEKRKAANEIVNTTAKVAEGLTGLMEQAYVAGWIDAEKAKSTASVIAMAADNITPEK